MTTRRLLFFLCQVALISNNRVEWGVSCFASYGLGAQVVPLYEAQTEKDWSYILRDSSAQVLLVSSQRIYQQTLGYLGSADFPELQHIVCLDAEQQEAHSYRALLSHHSHVPPPAPITPHEDDLVAIIYTSGSTGPPKGVELSHKNIMANLKGIREVWAPIMSNRGRLEGDTSVNYLPWGHIFGFTTNFHTAFMTGDMHSCVISCLSDCWLCV